MLHRIKYAIVRRPGPDFAQGLTTFEGASPDFSLALRQHDAYCDALRHCGVEVEVLDALDGFPDAPFVEDTAIVLREAAILCRPGALSRQGEVDSVREALAPHKKVVSIEAPGCVDGGDILRWHDHFFIGLSLRTNPEGARQLSNFLERYGYTSSTVEVGDILHLKTGITGVGTHLLASPAFSKHDAFQSLPLLEVPNSEAYAANSIRLNDHLITPAGFPQTRKLLELLGCPIVEVPMSEFEKMDGGLTCCSLLF